MKANIYFSSKSSLGPKKHLDTFKGTHNTLWIQLATVCQKLPKSNFQCQKSPKGRSQTTLLSFWLFDHLPPSFYLTKSQTFWDYLSPSFCKRSLWITPIRVFPIFKALYLLKTWPIFDELVKLFNEKLDGNGVKVR